MSGDGEIRFVGDLQRIERKPGDLYVLQTQARVDVDQAERIHAYWQSAVGGDARLVILDHGCRLGVIGTDPTRAAQDVLAERKRQIDQEGYTPEHDDEHAWEITEAAICYAQGHQNWRRGSQEQRWPWELEAWKPKDKRTNLVRAAALLLAEIERIDRAAERLTKGATV